MKTTTPDIRYVKPAVVRAMLGNIRAATLRQLVADGIIPAPVELSCRLKLYEYHAVVEAVRKRTRKA
jgi:hypothetical protein